MIGLFVTGMIFALADPYHGVQAELNWIRYWTAGVLGFAGAIGIWYSIGGAKQTFDRLFGGSFGLLLILAACDEIFQFHERGILL